MRPDRLSELPPELLCLILHEMKSNRDLYSPGLHGKLICLRPNNATLLVATKPFPTLDGVVNGKSTFLNERT